MVTFRVAIPEDAPRLLELLHALIDEERVYLPSGESPHRPTLTELQDVLFGVFRQSQAIVAVSEGRVVGFMLLLVGPSSFFGPRCMRLHNLYVVPANRSQGIGRGFLADAAQRARDYGMDLIELTVARGNHRAVQFYERLGGTPAGDFSIYRFHRDALVSLQSETT